MADGNDVLLFLRSQRTYKVIIGEALGLIADSSGTL